MKISVKYCVTGLLSFLFITTGWAQQQPGGARPDGMRPGGMPMAPGYRVVGMLVDSATQQPLEYASVDLISIDEQKIIDGLLTDTSGKFKFTVEFPGVYRVRVLAVDYRTYRTKFFTLNDTQRFARVGRVDMVNLRSENDSVERIEGVEIVAQGQVIENRVDRLVYNASQDLSSRGSSASDLLAKVPMVEVDMDGNVSIRGSRNLKVLINGRPSGLMTGSVADALRALPADEIDRVEVITNPSAKYDAEGTAGIINIIMKESRLKGTSGNVRAGIGTRSANFGGNVSHQTGKSNFSAQLGGHFWRTWGDYRTERYNSIDGISYAMLQTGSTNNWGGGPRLTLSFDHQFNEKNGLSVSSTLRSNMRWNNQDWLTQQGLKSNPLDFSWSQDAKNNSAGLGADFNVDYRRKFDKANRELGVSVQLSNNRDLADYEANRLNGLAYIPYLESSENVADNNELTAQIDYTEPLHKKATLELGAKTILRDVASDYHFDTLDFASQQLLTLDERNNAFTYYQNVYGGYAQILYNINSSISLRAGGRYEYTEFGGGLQKPSDSSFVGKPYSNFIPYINLSKNIGRGGFARITYTQRIQRPSLNYLNPYGNTSDPLKVSVGNPELEAEVSHNVELNVGKYGRGGGWGLNIYNRNVGNAIQTIGEVNREGVYYSTYENLGISNVSGFDLNLNLKGDAYMLNFNGGLGYVYLNSGVTTGPLANLSNSGFTYSAGLRGSVNMKNNWQLEAFGRFNAPNFTLQGVTTNWFFHMIGAKKRFASDKGGLGFGLDNPLAPRRDFVTLTQGADFYFYDVRRTNMWGVRVNFDYRFGEIEVDKTPKVKRKLQVDDLKDGGGDVGM